MQLVSALAQRMHTKRPHPCATRAFSFLTKEIVMATDRTRGRNVWGALFAGAAGVMFVCGMAWGQAGNPQKPPADPPKDAAKDATKDARDKAKDAGKDTRDATKDARDAAKDPRDAAKDPRDA